MKNLICSLALCCAVAVGLIVSGVWDMPAMCQMGCQCEDCQCEDCQCCCGDCKCEGCGIIPED